MEQFNLDKWLKDKSRKVVTRQGNPVRIVCTDRKHAQGWPIVALESYDSGEFVLYANDKGRTDLANENIHDLFFADEKPETIEVSFGAKDSEFVKDEYHIPDGCKARIDGNKVIIEKIQKEEELTEFEKALDVFAYNSKLEASNPNYYTWLLKSTALNLLDLARKELKQEFNEEEELTELQKTLEEDCDCYVNLYNDGKTREELREWIKCWCNRIIDLAKKKVLKEQEHYILQFLKKITTNNLRVNI